MALRGVLDPGASVAPVRLLLLLVLLLLLILSV